MERNIKLNYLNTFITNLNMQNSIWVLYLGYCGMNLTKIGILEGIYHATSILCEIPSGAMADLLGRRKSMILSRICVTISCIIMLFFKNFWFFALSFMIQALGNNLNSGSEEALLYDSMKCAGKEKNYMGVYGKRNVIMEVAQGIATVLGGVVAEYSYFWCYSACLVIAVLAILPVAFMTEAPYVNTVKTVKHHFAASLGILKSDSRIIKIIIYYAVVFAAQTLLFFYSQQYYAELGYSKIQLSLILLLIGVVSCLGAIMSKKFFQIFGKKITVIGAIAIAAAIMSYGLKNAVVAIAAFVVAGFFNSVILPVQSDALNNLIPSEQRATLISVDSMFFSIAMIIMFPIAGIIADKWGLATIFVAIGIALLIFISGWNLKEKFDESSNY